MTDKKTSEERKAASKVKSTVFKRQENPEHDFVTSESKVEISSHHGQIVAQKHESDLDESD